MVEKPEAQEGEEINEDTMLANVTMYGMPNIEATIIQLDHKNKKIFIEVLNQELRTGVDEKEIDWARVTMSVQGIQVI
jgi:hypothetical protein